MLPGRDIEASQSLAKEIGKITKCQAAYDRKRDALDRDLFWVLRNRREK